MARRKATPTKAFALIGAVMTGAKLIAPKALGDPPNIVVTVVAPADGTIAAAVTELLNTSVRVRVDDAQLDLELEGGGGG